MNNGLMAVYHDTYTYVAYIVYVPILPSAILLPSFLSSNLSFILSNGLNAYLRLTPHMHHCSSSSAKRPNDVTFLFSRVLRDSTPRFVGPSVRPLVGRSVRPSHFTFFWVFGIFGFTAPAQMIW